MTIKPILRQLHYNFLLAGTALANKLLLAGTVPGKKFLLAGTPKTPKSTPEFWPRLRGTQFNEGNQFPVISQL